MKRAIVLVAATSLLAATSLRAESPAKMDLERAISRALLRLPEHTILDSIAFRLGHNNQVTLDGEVTSRSLKESADRVLSQLPGVGAVVDNLRVRPLIHTNSIQGE